MKLIIIILCLGSFLQAEDIYNQLIKTIPAELQLKFKKPVGENAYDVLKEVYEKKLKDTKTPTIPSKAFSDNKVAKQVLKKYAGSLKFFDRISRLDYAIPKEHKFSFIVIEHYSYSYLRFMTRLSCLRLQISANKVEPTIRNFAFMKRLGDQPHDLTSVVVAMACQRALLTELKKHKLSKKSKKEITKNLLTKNAFANAFKAELYTKASAVQYFASNPIDLIPKALQNKIDKETAIKNYKPKNIFAKLIERTSFQVSFYEGKITFKEMSLHLKKLDQEIQSFIDMAKKNPELIRSDERIIRNIYLEMYNWGGALPD